MNDNTIEFVPVFYPTEEEFADFQGYLSKLDQESSINGHGSIKVLYPYFQNNNRSCHQKVGNLAKKITKKNSKI